MKKLLIGLALITGSAFDTDAQENKKAVHALSGKQQKIVRISALTAKGDLEHLKPELNAGLDSGLTVNEIKEVLVHLYAYSGFPRSLRGLQTFMAVLDERKAKGITDKPGPSASAINDKRSKYERGKAMLEKLSGVKESGPRKGYAAFSPEIEVFLKEHLFADIFERDVLDYTSRELVTVSVITALGGLEPMLSSHLGLSLNVGLTPAQLTEMIDNIEVNIGKKEADDARPVLAKVLDSNPLKNK